MKNKLAVALLMILFTFLFTNTVSAWQSYFLPRVIAGGGAGYFRISLDNCNNLFRSKWSGIYSGHVNLRFYRSNYLTIQYEKYRNDNAKEEFKTPISPLFEETFYNVGVRWYSEPTRKWNFYTSLGLTFTKIIEKPGLSVFPNSETNSNKKDGRGFFAEFGADYSIFPHAAFFMEIEASSVGEGGMPGFVGQSLGGFAFQAGIDFHF